MGVERRPWPRAPGSGGGGKVSGDKNSADDGRGGGGGGGGGDSSGGHEAASGIIPNTRPADTKKKNTASSAHNSSSNSSSSSSSSSSKNNSNRSTILCMADTRRTSGEGIDVEHVAADPATPPRARGWCRDSGPAGGRRRWRRPTLQQLEVTRSPSYLHGSGGLTISSPPVSVPGRRAGPPRSRSAALSPTRGVTSRTNCSNKATAPLRGHKPKKGTTRTITTITTTPGESTGNAVAAGGSNGLALPPPFLPPPPIQRDSCCRRCTSADSSTGNANARRGGGGGGGGGLLGGVPMTPTTVRDRERDCCRRMSGNRNLRAGSGGSWNGSSYPTGGATGGGGDTPTAASTLGGGSCSTPRICSPPTSCQSRATIIRGEYIGGRRGRSSRSGSRGGGGGVDSNERFHRLRGCCGDHGYESGSAAGGEAAAAAGATTELSGTAGDSGSGSGGSDGARGGVDPPGSASSGGDMAAASGSGLDKLSSPEAEGGEGAGGRHSTVHGTDGCGGDGAGGAAAAAVAVTAVVEGGERPRDRSADTSSSVERFSDDLDAAGDDGEENGEFYRRGGGGDAAGWSGGGHREDGGRRGGSRRGRGVSRRRRRGGEELQQHESAAGFRGRVAAIASATRICVAANNASVIATPPHPIPRVTTPMVPRRRQHHASPPISVSPPPEWATPSRGMGRGRGGAAAGRSSGFDGGGGVGTKSLVRGDKSLRPSEKTVPRPRLWPDFDDVRYTPAESEITTSLWRSDWTVEHGSALHTLKATLDAAARRTSGSSSPDLRVDGKNSLRQRYEERSEHFRLIQKARESAATQGSAMFRVMLQRRAAEEAARREAELKAARLEALKAKILMRMMEGRRNTFLAWAKHTRAARKTRQLLSLRVTSLVQTAFIMWRNEARRQKRVREFAIRYMAGSKRTTFTAWRDCARRSVAVRQMALGHLHGAQKACFNAWRRHTQTTVRRRELAVQRSNAAQFALSGVGGTRGLFLGWKAWAGKAGKATRMARRLDEDGLRRCFEMLAANQLKIRSSQNARRLTTLANAFAAWKIGLGRILRSRLLPAAGEALLRTSDNYPGPATNAGDFSREQAAALGGSGGNMALRAGWDSRAPISSVAPKAVSSSEVAVGEAAGLRCLGGDFDTSKGGVTAVDAAKTRAVVDVGHLDNHHATDNTNVENNKCVALCNEKIGYVGDVDGRKGGDPVRQRARRPPEEEYGDEGRDVGATRLEEMAAGDERDFSGSREEEQQDATQEQQWVLVGSSADLRGKQGGVSFEGVRGGEEKAAAAADASTTRREISGGTEERETQRQQEQQLLLPSAFFVSSMLSSSSSSKPAQNVPGEQKRPT